MNQINSKITQEIFIEIIKKYPEKLNQSNREEILIQLIKKYLLDDFMNIFQSAKNQNTKNKDNKVKKVLDQNQNSVKESEEQQKFINNKIVQCVKMIVKNENKNETNNGYEFKQIAEKIQNVKAALKNQLKNNNEDIKKQNESQKIIKKQKNTHTAQNNHTKPKVEEESKNLATKQIQSKKNSQKQIPKINQNFNAIKQVKEVKKQVPASNKPKSNSLFVQKQVPITQENIFKGQNFRRPSSRLHNKNLHANQKPKSSTKSNRSKRSNRSKSSKNQSALADNDNHSKLTGLEGNESKHENPKNQAQLESKNSDIQQENQEDNHQHEESQNQQNQQNESQEQTKQKRKLYDLNDESFLPKFKLSNQSPVKKKSPIQSILANPYIKKAFTHLCKQNYIGGGKTFDLIAQSADTMTINKWMVFCKQFDFLSALKRKQLVDIYHQCTQNKTFMNQKQFLQALIIVQNKLKVDQQDFIRQKLCLDSDLAFRQKVASFKINFGGPKYNCFQQATILPLDKYYQNLREQKYQRQKEKRKQYILHQGKFQQQIQYEINQRKKSRILAKSINHINKNELSDKKYLQSSLDKDKNQKLLPKSPYLKFLESKSNAYNKLANSPQENQMKLSKMYASRKMDPLTYSDIFKAKGPQTARQLTNSKKSTQNQSKNLLNSPNQVKKWSQPNSLKAIQKGSLTSRKPQSNITPYTVPIESQIKNFSNTLKDSPISKLQTTKTNSNSKPNPQQTKPQRQWTQNIKNWAQQFDKSQSQQSDDILRQHLINQKSKENKEKLLPQKTNLSKIMDQMIKDEKWLEDQDENQNWQKQTQLQLTKKEKFK